MPEPLTGTGTDVDLPVAPQAQARCRSLLDQAVASLAGKDGVLYSVVPGGKLEAFVELRDRRAPAGGAGLEIARGALRAAQPVLSVVGSWPAGRPANSEEPSLALPLELDGTSVGVLMVTGIPAKRGSVSEALQRLGDLPELIAVNLDRARALAALDKRGDELAALRRQLDAYAVDFRSTYLAERDRSRQLASALAALEATYKATVAGLAMAVEAKDEYTGGHLYRVSRYGMLVTALAAPEHAHDPQFEYGFLLHDVGKLTIPDNILNKPGALTDAEWEIVRGHPATGRSILEGIEFLQDACEIVYSHHERWDGRGYPRGLRADEIPLGARIFPLCDAFDAMTTNRPYRTAMPTEAALERIRAGSGAQFWSEAVEAFLSIPEEVLQPITYERTGRPS
ncbi:MAG: HD-GYP domain-containing protein [Acidimicrobiales bacterium]